MSNRQVYGIVVLAIAAITLLGLPLAAGAQSSNGITSVKDGATVSGNVEIKGNASDPNFWKWQLDLLPGGDAGEASFLALGTSRGQFSYTLNTTLYPDGNHALRVRVVRTDANYSEYITKITVANQVTRSLVSLPTLTPTATTVVTATAILTATMPPTATPMPVANGITSLTSGATVSGTIVISGYASDPSFQKWQLDLLPSGSNPDAASTLTVGFQSGRFTYSLDTTRFPNGGYDLRLRVVRLDGNYSQYVTQFTTANPTPTPQPTPIPTRAPFLPNVQGQD
jgi:hypothetical protein